MKISRNKKMKEVGKKNDEQGTHRRTTIILFSNNKIVSLLNHHKEMKRAVIWVVTPCNWETIRRFGETSLSSSGSKNKPKMEQAEAGVKLNLAFSEIHGVTTQNNVVFMVTAVRISNRQN
jgi:hypothetical protein